MELTPAGSSDRLRVIFMNDRGLRAGWRLLIYLAMIATLSVTVNLVAAAVAKRGGSPSGVPQMPEFMQRIGQAIVELIFFVVLLFFAWIMSRIERRKVGMYGLPLSKSIFATFFSAYLLWGFLPLTVLLFLLRAAGIFYFGSLSPLNIQILGWALLWWFFFLIVSLFEEFLFRGYLLYTLADGIGFWPAAVILAVGFARAHMGNTDETRVGVVATACFALFASATLWRTGNLWMAVGAHAGWDWGQSFFFGVNDSGFQAPGHLFNPQTRGPDWLTGGTVGPEGSVTTLVLWLLMTAAVIFLYRPRKPELVITIDSKT
jgi:CAAX protease family protein